ncbi:phage tail tape measure protein [Lacrimispora sp. AGF001]|uniref:phage tail tape measure protein n=1 Tax=Lacrimispora sp. AGF001 TaxID=3401631 RepID=UPI003B429E65
MANKEYELAIRIAGMIDQSLGDACNLTKKQLRSVAKEAASATKENTSFSTAMKNSGSGIDSMWNGATNAVKTTAEVLLAAGAAAGVAGGVIINVGSDFESAFAGVRKTVNATDAQMADLEEGIREMAKNKPQTAVELSEIAEAAGQLGIHTENIEDFTSTMADLKVATNLGDEGAAEFAKFANIVGMSQDKFENLGSAVVALGNNSATTEADIMEMAMRVAGAGHQVGMTEADILGFAASLSSVGIDAEAGGSAISKVMVGMQLATEKGGESLNQFANVANMSSSQFATLFKEDSAKAITAFIAGLNDTDRLGQSAIATLDDMDIKEVRLRDTLLRAASASDLFNNTLDLSSRAFEENTALTKEAEQRYATFESRTDMVKNRITDMGITLYQDFRDPLSDALDVALQFTDKADLFDPKYIDNVAKNFQKSIPTVIRQVKDAKDAVVDFAGPFIEVGDWMIEHPDIIAGTLAGIGTTITSLKLIKTVQDAATAMNVFRLAMMGNPITAALGVIALAGGAIIGVSTKMKMANAEMKKQNLAEHFGDISLSLGELNEMAAHIVGEKTLNELSTAMEELGKVSDISDELKRSSQSLNKLVWKIGMGIELDDADKESFKNAIDGMVESSIDLVEQAQFTAQINVKALFGEGNETGRQLINGFDSMYAGINTEVKILGKRLGEAYNDAMEDGIISTDEAKIIQELQEQLATITEQVSQAQTDAAFERIRQEYSGKKMDADTFQNLQNETQELTNNLISSSRQSYQYTLGSLNLRLERSKKGQIDKEDPDYLTQAGYNNLEKETNNQYAIKRIEIGLNQVSFGADTLKGAYNDELSKILPDLSDMTNKALISAISNGVQGEEPLIDWTAEQVGSWMNMQGLSDVSRQNITDLWNKSIEPQFKEMMEQKKQLESEGKEIDKALADGIKNAAAIGTVAGSRDAMYALLGDSAKNNPEFQNTLALMQEAGGYIPEYTSIGITNNINAVNKGVDTLYSHAQEYLASKFGNMTVYGNVDFNMEVGKVTTRQSSTANPHGVVGHATGGIFDEEHLAWVSEGNKAEAIVPLDGSNNAKSIWQAAGEALGVVGTGSQSVSSTTVSNSQTSTESNPVFAPVFHIYGGDQESIKKTVDDSYQKFSAFMKRYQKDHARLSF